MAESKMVLIISLNGMNYPSWKVQCRMALVREGLWGIVTGTEDPPNPKTEATQYVSQRDKALAMIVLAVDLSLLYLLGDTVDPVAIWRKLSDNSKKNLGK